MELQRYLACWRNDDGKPSVARTEEALPLPLLSALTLGWAPPSRLVGFGHAVSEAALTEDVFRVSGIVAEFAAELADDVAHGLGLGAVLVVPYTALEGLVSLPATENRAYAHKRVLRGAVHGLSG